MADYQHLNGFHIAHDSAHSLGPSTEGDSARVQDLEEQVKALAEKQNNASQRFADYENEIRVLQAKLRQEQRRTANSDAPDGGQTLPQQDQRPGISRFGSFMGQRRKPDATATNGYPQSPATREKELESQLIKEQTLRIAAEQKIKDVNGEIEDLSATLFQQANEMVADERRENAALREKIQALEKTARVMEARQDVDETSNLEKENGKLKERITSLEQREMDRNRRLDVLEAATKRIERVRSLLVPP